MLDEKKILRLLRYANDELPALESKCHQLGSAAADLQITKKQLVNEVAALRAYKYHLQKLQEQCQIDIAQKRQNMSNLDQQLNRKIYALEERLAKNDDSTKQPKA